MKINKKQPKTTIVIKDPKTGKEIAREEIRDPQLAHLVPGEEYLLVLEQLPKSK